MIVAEADWRTGGLGATRTAASTRPSPTTWTAAGAGSSGGRLLIHLLPQPSCGAAALAFFAHRADGVAWIHRLLTATSTRPARYGCFGLHEWAMVYRTEPDQFRHPGLPLRLSPGKIADVVERGVRCSHFDAYRFFTPAARPLNLTVLDRAQQVDHDQPGCLHVGMDLFTWAGKLGPAAESELGMGCFALARDLRRVDMRASPYDVTSLELVRSRSRHRQDAPRTSRPSPVRRASVPAH